MRQKLLLLGLVAAAVSLPAMADDNYEDRGRVISVTPQVQRVNTPRQECRTEYVRESVYENRSRSNTGAVIGGVSGGLLGSTIGRGNGRVAAAVVGAGLGAIIGDRVDNDRGYDRGRERVVSRPVESCVTVDNWSQVPAGYLVNYEYNGRQYSTVTERDPGRFIPVNVAVRPNGYVTQVEYSQSRGDDEYDRGDRNDHDNRGHRWGRNKHHDRHEGREHGYW
jgi:uncharacterized protein YcfJ